MPETTPVPKLKKTEAAAEWTRLAEAIGGADVAYYQKDAPHLSEGEKDGLRLRLKESGARFPDLKPAESPTQTVGAALTSGFGKVEHLKPMLSLDNVFADEQVG